MRVCQKTVTRGEKVSAETVSSKVLTPDILIVGAGIAGGAIGAGLRGRGYSVVQIEASNQPLDTARGDHLGPRVVETLNEWNLLDAFFAAGAEKRLGAKWVTTDGEVVFTSAMDDLPVPFPYYIVLNHDLIATTPLEVSLADASYDYTLIRPATAKNFETGPEAGGGITALHLTTPEGEDITVKPRLTIGCDGRTSRVRQACGFTIAKTYDYERPFAVLFGPRGELQDPRNEITSYMSPNGGVSRIPRMHGQWKIGLAIDKADIPRWKASGQAERQALIAERSPALKVMETEVAGFYPVIRRETDHWVRGTTVLVGDACHTVHPARGQGMNFGIRSAAKLFTYLPEPGEMENAALVASRLAEYEVAVKPPTDEQLDFNHERGLDMDCSGPERMEKEIPVMRAMAKDPDAHFRYRMTMAGYADQLDAH